jgi:hypothetical protein
LAACGFDVAAGGVSRRASAGLVGIGKSKGNRCTDGFDGTTAEAAGEAVAVLAGSLKRSEFSAVFTLVANAISCAGWLGPAVAAAW